MADDTIETLDDWNRLIAACGCCPMPSCPVPLKECQSLKGEGYHAGYQYVNDYYLATRWDYADGGWLLYTLSGGVWASLGGKKVTPDVTTSITHSGVLRGGGNHSYVNQYTNAACCADAYAAMLAALNWNDNQMRKEAYCAAVAWRLKVPSTNEWQNNPINVTFVRYRWRIPDSFEGKWFKITWDEVFFPEDYDENNPDSPQPSAVNRDLTVEWTGPGDPTKTDSWIVGDWHVMNPPPENGETRVVNVRYQCYRSPNFGNKPQVTGESFDLTPA